jgi:hypothetical protein
MAGSVTTVRIATFNLENLDETGRSKRPFLHEHITLMRPQIIRLRAGNACSPETNGGQEYRGQPHCNARRGGAGRTHSRATDTAPRARRRHPAARHRPEFDYAIELPA